MHGGTVVVAFDTRGLYYEYTRRRWLGWVCAAMHVLHFAASRLRLACDFENAAFGTMRWQPLHHCQHLLAADAVSMHLLAADAVSMHLLAADAVAGWS